MKGPALGVSGTPGAGAQQNAPLLIMATLSAFAGAWVSARLLHKVTMDAIQWLVAGLLVAIALLLSSGMI